LFICFNGIRAEWAGAGVIPVFCGNTSVGGDTQDQVISREKAFKSVPSTYGELTVGRCSWKYGDRETSRSSSFTDGGLLREASMVAKGASPA